MRKLTGLAAVVLSVVLLASMVLSGCPYGAYPKEYIAEVLSDGDNTFVAYWLERDVGAHDVHLQKLDGDGDVLWDEVLFSGDKSRVGSVSMVGGDGVLVAWEVYLPENGGEGPHSFDHATLASVDSDGQVRWQQDFAEAGMQMVTGGGGGVIMAWQDGKSCYGRGVDSGGNVLWEETIGSGCDALWEENTGVSSFRVVVGGEGEVLILWNNYENHCFVLQKIYANGQFLWPKAGVTIEYAEMAFQLEPQIVSDGAGGAIIAWVENRSDQPPNDLYLQRISNAGQHSLRSVIEGPLEAMHPNFQAVGDEPMGIIAVWEGSGDGIELRVIRDNLLSSYSWPQEGVSICSGLNQSPRFTATSDGEGGVVVAWIDGDRRLYAQRLDGLGQKLWGDEGVLITHGACELSVWVVGDSDNGFVLGWTSGFNTYYPDDSYLQKIDAEGNILWKEGGIKLGP
jgi:hypothetical protein